MNRSRILLEKERRRRIIVWIIAFIALGVWFYEFPLYAGLKTYADYQGWGALESAPSISRGDAFFVLGVSLVVLLVRLFPGDYLAVEPRSGALTVHLNWRPVESLERDQLMPLEFKNYATRRQPSRDSGYIQQTRIASVSRPEIVFHDAVMSRGWWREKRVARQVERRLGGEVNWKDSDGILSGRPDPVAEARVQKRQAQLDEVARKPAKRGPVRMAHGMRAVIALALAGLAGAFLYAGYRIAGIVFCVLLLLIVGDWLLAILGFGQQPEKRGAKKQTK